MRLMIGCFNYMRKISYFSFIEGKSLYIQFVDNPPLMNEHIVLLPEEIEELLKFLAKDPK